MNEGERPPSADALASVRGIFFQECEEQLAALEASLAALQEGDADSETLNAAFRAVHSIKGGASALELERLSAFAHQFETALAAGRAGMLELDGSVLRVLMRSADKLSDLVRAAREGEDLDEQVISSAEADLTALAGPQDDSDDDSMFSGFVPRAAEFAQFDEGAAETRDWVVRFRPYADLYAKANEPLLILRDLAELGTLEVTLNDGALPALDALDCEEGYLSWNIRLRGACSQQAIREVFEFVEGDCDLEIALEEALPVNNEAANTETDTPRTNGDASPPPSAPERKAALATPTSPVAQTIRVDLERLDDLANLVGELVINHALLSQRIASHGPSSASVALALEDLDHLTRDLQDSVMAVRAQPLKFLFQRMARVVRDVESATGKQARLIIDGEDTEVDRTLIEGLADPLTHMIRNAIDHGLETFAERLALGKPPHGSVKISARHRAGRVIIQVADDGAGVNRARVRQTAIARGFIAADDQLSDEEIDHLIFLPSFSTAQAVSGVSGRGVGMDVVKCGVQALGGRITVQSVAGLGTTFTLSLPLTLAVLDGMVVSSQQQTFVAPLTTVLETIPLKSGDIQRVGANLDVLTLRGAHVPAIDLLDALALRTEPARAPSRFALVVEDDSGRRAALLVDDIQGQRQVVIKSLEANYRNVVGVAAATILGEGRVALILDVNSILGFGRRDERKSPRLLAVG